LSPVAERAGGGVSHRSRCPTIRRRATTLDNLALACVSCSLRKWAKQTGTDPDLRQETPLFNPRTQTWSEHFRWEGERIVPLTATARATAAALALNRPLILAIRQEEAARDRHPPA
jgi:hypothetical protein